MKLRNTIASTASTGREKMQAKGRESTKFMGPPQRSFPNILFPAWHHHVVKWQSVFYTKTFDVRFARNI
jgi:hypothetical protein